MKFQWKYLLLWLIYISSDTLVAQLDPALQPSVDLLFEEWDNTRSPGCAIAIFKDGKIEYQKGYGMANLEHQIPIDPQSVFYCGSVSKQFVTFTILLLEEEGKLDMDDDFRKYIPEFPDYGHEITIRHLIHHTSGIRDYLELWELTGKSYLDYLPDEAVLDLINRQEALNFEPGERYLYSNSCYFLLSVIVDVLRACLYKPMRRRTFLRLWE